MTTSMDSLPIPVRVIPVLACETEKIKVYESLFETLAQRQKA